MTLVRLIGNYKFDLDTFSPGGSGVWDGIRYTTDPVGNADYVISLNFPEQPHQVSCPKEHCWALIQEPPTRSHHHLHTSHHSFSRLYSCDQNLSGPHRILAHPSLGWCLARNIDWLKAAQPSPKTGDLSSVTSSLDWLDGHKKRLRFLHRLRKHVHFEWYGRGVQALEDKWDGLAPFRYSMAFENHRSGYYWTEKLIDCYLSWTMPIYYGCPRIAEYFPADSMVCIDLDDPVSAERIIIETVKSRRYEENLAAIKTARDLVLERYNTLAFLTQQIKEHEKENCQCKPALQQILARVCPQTVSGRLGFAARYQLEKCLGRPLPAFGSPGSLSC